MDGKVKCFLSYKVLVCSLSLGVESSTVRSL